MSKDEGNSINKSQLSNQMVKPPKISDEGLLNKELFRNIEMLDSENSQLKSALAELQEDLKEKDSSIEESHKIITKLKDEYSKIIKEFQNLERINSELSKENEINKKAVENARKTNDLINKLKEKNEELTEETNRLRKDNALMKSKIINNNNISSKKEQDIKDKELIISDLKERSDNWVNLIKEREQLINEQSLKIKELSDIIDRKDEQLKLMVNFSKEINKENKSNVQELTKQAVKTIKVFYNTLNNAPNANFDTGNKIEFRNEPVHIEKFEDILRRGKASFSLEDGLNGMMYIPPGMNFISKEFLMDMNFKTELIKGELFSGIIRELHFVKFLEQIFDKLNINDAESIKDICRKVIILKTNYDNLLKEKDYLKRINNGLIQKVKENDLYIKKLKENVDQNLRLLKERYLTLTKNIDYKVRNVKNNNIILKEKVKKETQKLKMENIALKNEIVKLKKDKLNLKKLLQEQKNNEKLVKELEKDLENKNNQKPWNNIIQEENTNNFNYYGINRNNNNNNNDNSNSSPNTLNNNFNNPNLLDNNIGKDQNNYINNIYPNNMDNNYNNKLPDNFNKENNLGENIQKDNIIPSKYDNQFNNNTGHDILNNNLNKNINPETINNNNNYNNNSNNYLNPNSLNNNNFNNNLNKNIIPDSLNKNNYNNELNANININPDNLNNNNYNNNLNQDNLNNLNKNNIIPNNFNDNYDFNQSNNNSNNYSNKISYQPNNNNNNIIYDSKNSKNDFLYKDNNINAPDNFNIESNDQNRERINNDLFNDYNLKLQEMAEENAKEKEKNSKKMKELENLLSNEKTKNSELANELNSLKLYSDELNKNISVLKQQNQNHQNKLNKKNVFTPQLFIKLFYKINSKIFSSSEYKKYIKIYDLKDIYAVYDAFKKTCEILKRQVYETHFEIDTTNTNTDFDENLLQNSRRAFINNSYRAVNERILKLKKFEFDIINLNEFIKNYLVSQEMIIQMIFNSNNNVIQFDIIEKLFKLLEECLNFKIDEMSDNVIFHRKLLIKYLKSQKNCLGLSLESLSS